MYKLINELLDMVEAIDNAANKDDHETVKVLVDSLWDFLSNAEDECAMNGARAWRLSNVSTSRTTHRDSYLHGYGLCSANHIHPAPNVSRVKTRPISTFTHTRAPSVGVRSRGNGQDTPPAHAHYSPGHIIT